MSIGKSNGFFHRPRPRSNHTMTLDGKEIAKNTVKHIVKSATYPTSVGRGDGRGGGASSMAWAIFAKFGLSCGPLISALPS
jgi:hypothetical protein